MMRVAWGMIKEIRKGVYTMNPLVVPSNALVEILKAAVGSTGLLLDNTTLRLFKADLTLGPNTTLAELTEADYTGYAAKNPILMGTPFDDANGNALQYQASAIFQPTGTTVSNTVFGWFIVGGDGTMSGGTGYLLCAKKFDNPISLASPLDAVVVDNFIAINNPVGV
jgi:hypothetical protein